MFNRRSMPQPQVAAFAAWPLGRSDDLVLMGSSFPSWRLSDQSSMSKQQTWLLAGARWALAQFSRFSVARLLQFFGSSEVQFPSVRITLIDSQTYK